ncbi:hypothetical protein [Chitinophaga caseinilytica]|uniref:hypothetical protein n=1 Tax=Chitinophaga caseinilytica TaxID=2267521 RepID=UPI003C2F2900
MKNEDAVSLRDIILSTQQWMRYLWSKWLVIVISGIVFAGLLLTYAFIKKPQYVGQLSFVVEDTKSSPLSMYAGIASQFGIDLGSGSGTGVFSGDNILQFLKSRYIVEKALLSPLQANGKTVTLADYYIDINNMREGWKEKPELAKLQYPVNANRKQFSLQQDSVLSVMYDKIIKNNLSVTKPDKKLSFINVKCVSEDEMFSKTFTEYLVSEAVTFYVQTKTQRTKATVDALQSKVDSIETLLNRKTYSLAATQDMNQNPARNLAGVGMELVARDKIVLQTMYGEVIKNLEISKMAMAQEAPIIQTIDKPILPLRKEKLGKLVAIIMGGFLGGFLAIVYLLVKYFYRKIMAS